MVYTQVFKDKILDYIKERISTSELGEDGTPPTVDDTSLGDPVSGTIRDVQVVKANSVLGISASRFNTDPASAYREIGLFDLDGDLILRVSHATINTTVTDNTRIRYNMRVFFE